MARFFNLRSMLLVALLLWLSPLLGQEGQYGPPMPPKLETAKARLDESTFDFGTVLQGDSPRHTFKVHNDGAAPLKLLRVKST